MAGTTYNDSELAVWQQRDSEGFTPIANRPDSWADHKARAVYFGNNPTAGYFTTDINTTDPNNTQYVVAASFEYLLNGAYASVVHDFLVNQVQEANADYESYFATLGTATERMAFSGAWVFRLFLVYDYTKDLYSLGEKAMIDQWFYNAGWYLSRYLEQRILGTLFTRRNAWARYADPDAMIADQGSQVSGRKYCVLNPFMNYIYDGVATGSIDDYTQSPTALRDYSALSGVASTGIGYSPAIYTHMNEAGVNQTEIKQIHGFYKNPYAMAARAIGVIGIYLNDDMLKDHARLFFEEWMKFGVYADGTTSEYRRNNGNGTTDPYQLGTCYYSVIVWESAVIFADLLRRNNDDSMYEFMTSDGIHGSEGGTKNIRLVIETTIEHCTSEVLRYCKAVNVDQLIDTMNGTSYRYLPEVPLSLANRYYNEQRIKDCYLLTLAGSNTYSASGWTYPTGGAANSWGGALGSYPDFVYMFHLTEDIVEEVEIIRGIKSMLMV
jgi:hypothetical protein